MSKININKIISVTIDNIEYYQLEQIMSLKPQIFSHYSSARQYVMENCPNDFIYLRYSKYSNIWYKTLGLSEKFDIVFVPKKWIVNNVPEYIKTSVSSKIIKLDYEIAPDLVIFDIFSDEFGQKINVEVRGIKDDYNKCYFRVRDIGKAFGIQNLYALITRKSSPYVKDIDYKFYTLSTITKKSIILSKGTFLTYKGLIKLILLTPPTTLSHNNYQNWLYSTLHKSNMEKNENSSNNVDQ